MSSNRLQTKFTMVIDAVYNLPQFLRYILFTFYCRLYKAYHTCFLIEIMHSMYYSLVPFVVRDRRNLEWKTHWQSPVCRAILKRKYFVYRSKSSLSWALYNCLVSIILWFDMNTKSVASYFVDYSNAIWYSELLTILILFSNACTAIVLYTWSIFSKPMPIAPVHQKLFGISEKDPGFELEKSCDSTHETEESHLLFTSWRDPDPSFLSVTPLNYSAKSWASSPSYCLDFSSTSWSYRQSPRNNYSSTPKSKREDSFLIKKIILPGSADSSFERSIKNNKQLDQFLKVCEEEEKKLKSMAFEESMSNVTMLDNSPLSILGKCRYQRASRLPSMEANMESDSSEAHCGGDVLHKLKISDEILIVWCERLRKWICQTILVKLVAEIDSINHSLSQVGLPEYQIGTVNLFALHQIAITKFQHLTTLPAVLSYLDMHLNQEYLVQRLRDLTHGGCMGEFKWNSGGSFGDKPWCDDLPTDSAIVMHVFCCYLDAYLPPEPHFPEGKPFSSKYFKKTPEKLILAKDLHFIYQSGINPPHFKVVIGQDIYSPQKGRNSLFFSFLIFFHYLKMKESAMLGRVNLGSSGLNILWVID